MSNPEVKMTIKTLARKGVAARQIARHLALDESTVRYHLKRIAAAAPDGRACQRRKASEFADDIERWRMAMGGTSNSAALHEWLTSEHGYQGSLRSVQRFLAQRYPAPRRRTRRRVETPPGAQAQVDWAHFPRVPLRDGHADLNAFVLTLSYSRMYALVWSPSQCQAQWLGCHNEALRRVGGVPAVIRIDNVKTAMSRGAGPWGTPNPVYQRYAQMLRFHIDPCLPRQPQAKGKVERNVRTVRSVIDPYTQRWDGLGQLQHDTDAAVHGDVQRRQCAATGTPIAQAWREEKPRLASLPALPEPFDTVATRSVGPDCMVSFEGRQYSVPFRLCGTRVEVRGTAHQVQVVAGLDIVATHPRGTPERVLIDTRHYEGEATGTHVPPPPLGRMGKVLEQLASVPVQERPADLYGAIADRLAR